MHRLLKIGALRICLGAARGLLAGVCWFGFLVGWLVCFVGWLFGFAGPPPKLGAPLLLALFSLLETGLVLCSAACELAGRKLWAGPLLGLAGWVGLVWVVVFGLGVFRFVLAFRPGFLPADGSYPSWGWNTRHRAVPTARLFFKAICIYPGCWPCRFLVGGWFWVLVGLGWSGFWGLCPCGSLAGPAFGYYDRQWQSIGDCLALLWNLPPVILLGKDLSVAFACVGLVVCSGSSVVLPFATS